MTRAVLFLFVALFVCAAPVRAAQSYEGYCALPYSGKVHRTSVQAVARAVAWLDALEQATEALDHTAAQFGTLNMAERRALTAILHRPMVSVTSGKLSGEAEEYSQVRVRLNTPPRTLDDRLREALRHPDALYMREASLRMTQDAVHEGESLALAVAKALETGDAVSTAAYTERLTVLASRLEALWLLDETLIHLRHTWQNPATLLSTLTRASTLDPLNPLIWNALGEVQLQSDKPQNALHSLDTALGLNPDLARALHARGLTHIRLRQYALAEADFDKALRLVPDHIEWLRSRGTVRMLREDYGPMCADFERACALGDCEGLQMARTQGLCLPATP